MIALHLAFARPIAHASASRGSRSLISAAAAIFIASLFGIAAEISPAHAQFGQPLCQRDETGFVFRGSDGDCDLLGDTVGTMTFAPGDALIIGDVQLNTGVNGLSTFDANVNLNGEFTQITNAVITTGTFSGSLTASSGASVNMGGNRIQNVGAPIAATDAATKAYVDAAVSGGAAINEEQDARLDQHDDTLAEHDTRITATEAKNIEQDATLVQHTETLSTHTTQIADLDDRVTANAQDIAALDDRVVGLETRVDEGFSRLDDRIDTAFEGSAMAMAMAGAALPGDKNYAVSINWGNFEGANAFAGSAQARVSENFLLHGGIGYGTSTGSVGGRAGVTFAW